MIIISFIPTIVILILFIIAILLTTRNRQKKSKLKGRYGYVQWEFSEQKEIDMRLPYKRFKELYPDNKWTYKEYKQIQKKTAFRRSHSSQDNKRMVR